MKRYLIAIALTALIGSPLHALVLENLIANNTVETTLKNKKVGFYVGSFDPIHKGHEAVAQECLEKGLCDYVILFPAWGGDSYKNRTDITLRHDMIFALFADHPHIIVTRLTPKEFQDALTLKTSKSDHKKRPLVKPKFGMTFIGIVGSDTALKLNPNDRALKGFMTGIAVPDQYAQQTIGGLMSLPVETFIVSLREGDEKELETLNGYIGSRKIISVLKNQNTLSASSTKVKELLKEGKSIDSLVSAPVVKIIEEQKLYQGK